MTQAVLSQPERDFLDEALNGMRIGRFGNKARAKIYERFADSGILTDAERVDFVDRGRLPVRLLGKLDGAASLASDYTIIDGRPSTGSLTLRPPIQHDEGPLPKGKFVKQRIDQFPTTYVVEATSVFGYIKNHRSLFETETGYIPELSDEAAVLARSGIPKDEVRHLSGKTAYLVSSGTAMFSHWTFDVLPRAKVLSDRGHSLSSFDNVLIYTKNDRFTFHDQGLAALGVRPEQVQVVKEGLPSIRFDQLLAPSPVRTGYFAEPWVYEEVRRLFMPRRSAQRNERIFLGRRGGGKRAILNIERVEPILEANSFRTVYAEDHSIAELAAIMNTATIVVGPHGAGFTNTAFCEPGTIIMELYGPHITDEFWAISNTLGFEHHILACKDESGLHHWQAGAFPVSSQREKNAAGFYVDEAAFGRALQSVL